MKDNIKKEIFSYMFIIIGSILYGFATAGFIFPHSLLLGGTSGISVMLNKFLPFSPGSFVMVMNFSLLIIALVVLGKEMAIKTLVGSSLTTLFIGLFEKLPCITTFSVDNIYLSSCIGAVIIAIASGIMFYVKSNSGGTDIIALVIKKYSDINIGKACLITDFLIVLVGGIISGYVLLISSFIGLFIKTFGIDFVIGIIKRNKDRRIKNVS